MFRLPKFSFLSAFLALTLIGSTSMLTLNSCIKDADEPVFVTNDKDDPDDPDDDGTDEPGDEGDEGEDNPGDEGDEGGEGDEGDGNEGEGGDDNTPGSSELTNNIKNVTVGETLTTTAVVTAQDTRGLVLTDNAGSILYYNTGVNLNDYPIGTVVNVTGPIDAYNRAFQLTSEATINKVGTMTYSYPAPKVYTAAMVDEACAGTGNMLAQYVSIEGTISITNNYYNVIIPGATAQGSIYYAIDDIKNQLTDGNSYTLNGYFTQVSGSSTKYFNIVVTEVKSNGNGNTTPLPSDEFDAVPSNYKYPLSYVMVPSSKAQQVKEYTSYTMNFNKDNHTANFVSWELLASETSGNIKRDDYDYWVDKDMDGCLSKDFAYSTYSYERGHMCPAADNRYSATAMKDCMAMTNMSPQLRALNSGLWGTLEDKGRQWAKKYGAVWIVAGPLYDESNDQLYIGQAKARVPSAYFKAFLYYNGANSKAVGFVLQNGSNPGDLMGYAMSIDNLEKATGYDFFSALPDEIEKVVEASFNPSDWN